MLKRILILGIVAAAAIAPACGRLREEAEIVSPEDAVLSIRAESDRRRPAYREVVVRLYPAIHAERAAEWSIEWGRREAR